MIYEDYAIFTPGPVKMSKEVLEVGGKQTPYFRNQKFSDVLLQNEALLLKMLNAPEESRVVFLTASGTAGMEATIINLLSQNNHAIVVNGGGFGQRFVDICTSYEVPNTELKVKKDNNLADIMNIINGDNFDTFIVNAHETSIGLLYDLNAIGKFCIKYNLFNIVDAISMFITDEIDMQKHHIDAVILSSQKGLALPPGLSMIVLSPRAIKKVKNIKSYYFNFKYYLRDGERGQTPYTPAVTILLQLLVRLKQIEKDGGVQMSIQKSSEIAAYFRKKILELPFEVYTKYMPNAMTALTPINHVSAMDIVQNLEDNYKTIICPNGGELQDVVFRVSHMGDMNTHDIDFLIESLSMNI